MSEAIISRVKQRLMNGTLSKEQAAQVLGALKQQPAQQAEQQPEFNLESFDPAGPQPVVDVKPDDRGFLEQATAAGEVALTLGTGVTGGAIGTVGGTLEQLPKELASGEFGTPEAAERIAGQAHKRAGQLTFEPRTELGRERVGQLGEALAPLAALPPIIPELGALSAGARSAAPRVTSSLDDAANIAREHMSRRRAQLRGGSRESIGAARVQQSQARRDLAGELPVPMQLTEGQASREFGQARFERESAKLGEIGAPLRERFDNQNSQIQQNVDAFIDQTGATSFSWREVGESVAQALKGKVLRDKARIRALYKDAEASGDMDRNVDVDSFVSHLNKNRAEREENGIMQKVQRQINALEIGTGDFKDGTLQIRDITLKDAEALRRFINRNTGNDPNEIRVSSTLKRLIDDSTEGVGGEKYKTARGARIKFREDFESMVLMKQLTGLKKGTEERVIALEDVLRRSIISPASSRDSIHKLRRVLQNSGKEGKQAWKDIQGGTLHYIQDEMLKNSATNERGDLIVSVAKLGKAVRELDGSGKLDLLYGKKGAEQIRMIDEVAKTVLTSPPGTINTSNTATVLAGLMDVAATGMTGVPLPIMTSFRAITRSLKDKKLKARVAKALNNRGS